MKPIFLIALCVGLLGCESVTMDQMTPAVLKSANPHNTRIIEHAISTQLNKHAVKIADHAFIDHYQLDITQRRQTHPLGLNGRIMEKPLIFTFYLYTHNQRCVLVNKDHSQKTTLKNVDCIPYKVSSESPQA